MLQKQVLHLRGQRFLSPESFKVCGLATFVTRRLILDDVPGNMSAPSEAQQQVMLELVDHVRAETKWIYNHLVPEELNEIAAPECGGILVLHSPFNANIFSLDHIGYFCNLVVSHWDALKFLQKSHQGHHQT